MPETVAHTRELLAAPEPLVRAAAVHTISTLRDPTDAERFQQLLAREHHRDVRAALANGLGYVGSASAATSLLRLLESADQIISNAAITALGRLSERGVLDQPTRTQIASALTGRMRLAPVDGYATRERLLWAMSRVGDPRFGAQFIAALNTPDSVAVRLAAVRGIAVMADPRTVKANGQTSKPAPGTVGAGDEGEVLSPRELVDALVPVASDPDAGVRRAAVETLAQFATSDAHVEALWARLAADREPEEGIRMAAWRGASRVIAGRPADEIERWLKRLPGDEATRGQQAVELLQAAEQNLASKPDRRGELGRVRVLLAGERAALDQIEPAIATYLLAIDDLHAANSSQIPPVALELLRLALLNDRYDAQIATALAQCNPALDGQELWEGVVGEIEQRLQPDEVDCAITMLAALQANPPTSMPADTQQALQDMLQHAREVQSAADAALVSAALQELREKPDDEQAQERILNLGSRAAPTLRDALRQALQAEQPDTNQVQQLYDLLKTLVPDWPGFAPDATTEEKLNALDALTAE
jgi:HEAT repeat protein